MKNKETEKLSVCETQIKDRVGTILGEHINMDLIKSKKSVDTWQAIVGTWEQH